jgi:hypothetical protein
LVWETGSVGAAGVFTVPLNPDGSITFHTAGPTSIRVAVTGYWKIPTGTDTGLGLDLLDAPTRLVDTTNSTGTVTTTRVTRSSRTRLSKSRSPARAG